MKFKKGKWYKIDNDCYIKYQYTKKEDGDIEIYGETIEWEDYEKEGCLSSCCNWLDEAILLENLSEISSFLPENHVDKQLKPEDFIGKWVLHYSSIWNITRYIFVNKISNESITTSKIFWKEKSDCGSIWVYNIDNLSDLQIVSDAEVAKKAIEYGHDLRELGLHQFISISKTIKKEDLYNTKIWIGDNKELNKKVQERLFELGFYWFDSGKNLFLDCEAIFLFSDKNLSRIASETFKNFKCHKHKEITLTDLGLATKNELLIQKGLEIHKQFEQSLNTIQIIPIIKTTDINIPNIILTNNKLTI